MSRVAAAACLHGELNHTTPPCPQMVPAVGRCAPDVTLSIVDFTPPLSRRSPTSALILEAFATGIKFIAF